MPEISHLNVLIINCYYYSVTEEFSAGLTTRLTRLQPRAPDFLGAPERPRPREGLSSLALCVKSVKS